MASSSASSSLALRRSTALKPEVIVCAAILFDGTDKILLGHRHNEIINEQARFFPVWPEIRRTGAYTQGFFTSHRRFLDRSASLGLALGQGQVVEGETVRSDELYSEDMW